jgi:hypothetical protein
MDTIWYPDRSEDRIRLHFSSQFHRVRDLDSSFGISQKDMNEVEENDSNHNHQKSLLSNKNIKRVSLHWEESSYHIHLSFWTETSSRTRTFLRSLTFHLMKDTDPTPSIHSRIFFFFRNNPLPSIEIVDMSVFCWSHSFSYFQIHMIQFSRDRKTLQTFDRFSKSIHECTLLCNETSSNTSSSISIIDSFRLYSHLTPSLILRLVRERTCLQSICLDSSNTSIVRFDLCWEFHHSSRVVLRVRERRPLDSIRVESSRTSMTRDELFVLRVQLLENRFESSRTSTTRLDSCWELENVHDSRRVVCVESSITRKSFW